VAVDRLVLFVHGLWMPGPESLWFRRRVAELCDARAALFAWRTTAEEPRAVAERLLAAIAQQQPAQLHLVGHSLGGLAVLKFLELHPGQPPGRVVLLGSPTQGSLAAEEFVSRFGVARRMVGPMVREEILAEGARRVRRWADPTRPLGVIAGNRSLGIGRLFARFSEPNDGTVAVRETQLDGAADRITLPVSHLGMMVSPEVASQTAHFLREGRFSL
jgi:pimeloyl-ACP methyl ester carboxylesterase